MQKILILGATGMIGQTLFRCLATESTADVYGTVRSAEARHFFAPALASKLIADVDASHLARVDEVIATLRPDVVINAIGLVKQLEAAHDPVLAITFNSLLPHQLAALCKAHAARFIQISTDCVFSGTRGDYRESDAPDATDLYGRSKVLGEVVNVPHAITLRTSTVGHELKGGHGLVGWFLAQQGSVKGYRKAIYSGLPTVELARVIRDFVLPRPELHGLYHVAGNPIDKYSLLTLVAQAYGVTTGIIPDDAFHIDRSLNAERFHAATGYRPPAWPELVRRMEAFR